MENPKRTTFVERRAEQAAREAAATEQQQARSGSCDGEEELGGQVRYLADTGANFLARPVMSYTTVNYSHGNKHHHSQGAGGQQLHYGT